MCDCLPCTSFVACSVVRAGKLWPNAYNSRQFFFSGGGGRRINTSSTNSRLKARRNSEEEEEEGGLGLGFGFKEKGGYRRHFELESGFDESLDIVVEAKDNNKNKNKNKKNDDLVGIGDKQVSGSGRAGVTRRGRQVMRRSNMVAKQVISVQSALTLGFVSQLWVDISSWFVLVVEVRPYLLSGESERFLLQDVSQVGDVVLVADEHVMENDLKMVGLETLVGYQVVTPGRRNIGKVRGYSFNVNSGAVESLELDSFGISVIPASLVSTYALLVEDVLEVLSDTVIVHEAAASRIQRLTKGFWDPKNVGPSKDELGEYSDYSNSAKSRHGSKSRRSSGRWKFDQDVREIDDDWKLPMDYF